MALPIIQNNSTEIVDVLQTSMDINLDIFSFLEKYAEKQVKILQEILTVTKKQYEFNVDWRRDEEYQREELDREKQKPNPPETPEPSDPKPSAGDAGGLSLKGALAAALASLFASIKKSIESVITKLKSVFKPIISAFESVITKLKSAFRPVISAFESVITKLKSAFRPVISAFESVITKLKSAFKPIISVFESVITKLKSVFKPITSAFESVITKLKSVFKPITSAFETVITKLKSVFKPIISAFEPVFTVFKNILKFFGRFNLFGLIIFGIIDFITGFIDKFKAADSLGEGILEGLWGGITNAIRGIIAIPLDMLKDLTSWIAEKLGFSEVAKVLDSFSFVDLFNKATEWLYNTETDTWFGGALDDLGSLGEGILEGLWGGYTNVIRNFIYIPLDMLKDLTSWIAEKLGFSEVAKVLDSFSFVDLFDKATKWLYDTETNIWFGGALDDLPEKMKTLYTDLKTKLESFIKDYIYDGSGDKIKLFGQELPTFDDIGNWATSIKEKIGNFIKDNIYDGENNKIFGFTIPEKLFEFNMFTSIKQSVDDVIESIEKIFSGDFSMENLLQGASGLLDLVQAPLNLAINAIKDIFKWGEGEEGASEPFRLSKFIADTISNITNAIKDMFAWADEKFGFNITGTLKNFANMIYNPETGEIFGLNFEDLFDVFPSIDDIKKKLTGLIPDMFLGGGGDDSVDLSASTLDPGADEVDLKKLKKELDAGNEKAVMKYLSDTKSGDGIENEEEVLKILKTYGFYDGIISPRAFEDDSIPQAAEGGITPKPPGSSARNARNARTSSPAREGKRPAQGGRHQQRRQVEPGGTRGAARQRKPGARRPVRHDRPRRRARRRQPGRRRRAQYFYNCS
jgi:hypothetical protein